MASVLGKTTGWIHRAALKMKDVNFVGGVNYERIDDQGLHISFGDARENPTLIEAETIVLCGRANPAAHTGRCARGQRHHTPGESLLKY